MPAENKQKTTKTALKKKAVKKVAKKVVKKTTKKIAKKDSPSNKKTAPRKTAKKVVAKKKSVTKKDAEQKKPKDKSLVQETVNLPSGMSIKAVNKSLALKKELSEYINRSVYIVAYVSAICFILVGSFAAFSELFTEGTIRATQKAEIISASTTVLLTPQVDILTSIPGNIDGEFKLNFSARNVGSVRAFLRSNETGLTIPLDMEPLLDGKYRVRFSSNLGVGYYMVKIVYTPLGSAHESGLTTRTFFLGSENAEFLYNNPQKPANEQVEEDKEDVEEEADSAEEQNASEKDSSQETVERTPLKIAEPVLREESDFKKNSTSTEEINSKPDSESEVKSRLEEIEKPSSLELSTNNDVLSGPSVLSIKTESSFSFIELYARPLHSLQDKFVALAVRRTTGWVFPINTSNLPNGDYEFTAKAESNGKTVTSNSLQISIKNSSTVPKITELEQKLDEQIADDQSEAFDTEPLRPNRPFAESVKEEFDPNLSVKSDVERKANQLLNEDSEELDSLLKRYAVALQSGDSVLIATAESDLKKRRESIVLKTLQDEATKDISDNIDEDLKFKFEVLQQKVRTFEEIRKEKTSGNTSKDTDGDGISDFDELNLYQTDPASPDTDNDGINDGIEIMKGFNPRDEKPEALIVFESPKEVRNLQRDDVLRVESVVPMVEAKSNSDKEAPVRAEIRGTALPNSFVTLYIFSSPTVVTVKTDDTGAFVYTFDKELEDGLHEVYVAVTDNTGSIIAQSNPFSFVKEAQAFSPIDSDSEFVTNSYPDVSPVNTSYNLAIGLAVLSLGIILLMLGIGLRTKEQELEAVSVSDEDGITITDNTVKTDEDK
ncbi:hypothetical protein KC850_01850 [Candidatus Kaiserbacteria bacterium]|nr:hypothetical protein [Candidatus Kaiserbacteria bacterium]